MKNNTSKIQFIAIVVCLAFSGSSVMAQWDLAGQQKFTHGSTNFPQIQGSGAILELVENQEAPNGSRNGIQFAKSNGFNDATNTYMYWQRNTDIFYFGEVDNMGNDVDRFTIDVNNGNVEVTGELEVAGEIVGASDARLKKDMAPLTDALAKVSQLKPTTYQFRKDEFTNRNFPEGTRMGFIAQELEKEFPTLVSTGNEVSDIHGNSFDMKSVNYMEVIPLLTKAIQEQQLLIEQLTGTVASLKAQVDLQSTASASR